MKKTAVLFFALFAVLILTSCHAHSYDMEYYVYDEAHHWHNPTCKHQDAVKDREAHTFDADGICTVCTYDSSPYVMKLSYDGSYYILAGIKKDLFGEVTLPATYKGLPVKEIDIWAFNGDEYESPLTKVVIPDSYEIIDYKAFSNKHSLTEVVIGNGVKEICANAFEGCINLERVTFGSSLEAIYAEAFQYCEKLNHVVLPASLKEITYRAFGYCKSLTSIVIPRGVTTILSDAFYENDSLTDIYCEIEEQPEGWKEDWCGNTSEVNQNFDVRVTFGYNGEK